MQRYISGFYGLDIYLYAEIQIIFGTVYCVHAPKNLPFCRNARHLKRKQLEESIGECGVVNCGRVYYRCLLWIINQTVERDTQ